MISIIIGTNRPNSISKKVAIYYKSLLDKLNEENQIVDLNLLPEDFAFSALYGKAGTNDQFNIFRNLMNTVNLRPKIIKIIRLGFLF